MMAIRPPTSPTTLIGGFSFAIITKRHKNISITLRKKKKNRSFLLTQIRGSLLEWSKVNEHLVRRDLVKTCKHHADSFNPISFSYHSTIQTVKIFGKICNSTVFTFVLPTKSKPRRTAAFGTVVDMTAELGFPLKTDQNRFLFVIQNTIYNHKNIKRFILEIH